MALSMNTTSVVKLNLTRENEMKVIRVTRQTAIVTREAEYEVNQQDWQDLLESGDMVGEVLDTLLERGEATFIYDNVVLEESLMVHETETSEAQ
jgi:hypothetical protein